jgi:polysaccharide export outer membrane protein
MNLPAGWLKTLATGIFVAMLAMTGCSTPQGPMAVAPNLERGPQTLNVGDQIRVTFPGAPNLNDTQQIRRDGRINLQLVGEVVAVDKTPAQLESELRQAYATQIVSKEVNVTVLSSSFVVFVTGAVTKPGKVAVDHTLSVFEAIMEAGGFDETRANKKAVRVFREENGQLKSTTLNLKDVLDGRNTELFYLKPYDTIYVPDKISWF